VAFFPLSPSFWAALFGSIKMEKTEELMDKELRKLIRQELEKELEKQGLMRFIRQIIKVEVANFFKRNKNKKWK